MHLKKLLILGMAAASISISTTGCLVKLEYSDSVVSSNEKSNASSSESSSQRAENAVKSFSSKLLTMSFDGITDLLNLPDGYFISDDDAKSFFERTSLADIIGSGSELSGISFDGSAVEKTATITVNKKDYSFTIILCNDGSWKVDVPSLYVENWSLKVPDSCTVTVDGQDVASFKQSMQNIDAAYAIYTFPAISASEHEVKVTSSLYGTFTQKMTPQKTSDTYTVICKISEQETSNILTCIKAIWNGLYSDYKAGADVPSIRKYFTSTVDTNELTSILNEYFPQLEGGQNSSVQYSGFYVTDITPWTMDNYGAALLETNNSVTVNFGYRLEFVDSAGEYHNCNKATSIVMAYEDSTYKIKELSDTTLFTDNDYTNNDY